ncbi:30S ribosomal protein S9 [Candidatus Woesearchaeota archaeon]|nr:30S ribosomal protein S9 [Candidatus Woesearchaeota archaeon]
MKTLQASGKRKRAVARATISAGTGKVRINNLSLEEFGTPLARDRVKEPLLLAGNVAEKVDINVATNGGGVTGQADAVRLAIARALAEHAPALKEVFLDYDRTLLVADVRRKEASKPNSRGRARAKQQKSYR